MCNPPNYTYIMIRCLNFIVLFCVFFFCILFYLFLHIYIVVSLPIFSHYDLFILDRLLHLNSHHQIITTLLYIDHVRIPWYTWYISACTYTIVPSYNVQNVSLARKRPRPASCCTAVSRRHLKR